MKKILNVDLLYTYFLRFRTALFFTALLLLTDGCSQHKNARDVIEAKNYIHRAVFSFESNNWEKRKGAVDELITYCSKRDNNFISNLYSHLKDDEDFRTLFSAGLNDPHSTVRLSTLNLCSFFLPDEFYNKIREMAIKDRSDNVKWYALTTLSLYKRTDALDIFIISLDDDDWIIRETAIRGILMFDFDTQKKYIPYIIKAINDANESVSVAALVNVKVKDENLYRAISSILVSRKDPRVRLVKALLIALNGYLLDDATRQKVIDLLPHPNRDIRIFALRVLKKEKSMQNEKSIKKKK